MGLEEKQTDQAARDANMALVRRFLEAINRWDFNTMREALRDDFVFELPYAPPGLVRRIEGGTAFVDFVRRVPETFDEERLQAFRIETYASDPHELVAEYRSDMQVVATGERYRNTYVSRFTIRDGKIARFAEYCDPVPLLEALGGRVEFDGSAAI